MTTGQTTATVPSAAPLDAGGNAGGAPAQLTTPGASDSDLLAALLEAMGDQIYFKDLSSCFVSCSRETARRAGFEDPNGLIGKTDHDIFTSEHADAALADEQHILRTGKPVVRKVEKETYTDGSVRWVLTTKVAHRDSAGHKDISLLEGRNFLPKPYSVAKLAQFVRTCLDAPAPPNWSASLQNPVPKE
jgi:PAS domain S-box-containing protein